MKCVLCCAVLLVLGLGSIGADILPRNCVEIQILELLTKWQKGDITALPTLDSISIPSVDGVYDGYGIKITYTTGDMQLAGVHNFLIEELSVNAKDLTASTSIHFPMLTLTAENYSLKGRAYMLYTLKGSGLMKATFESVKVKIGTRIISNSTVLHIEDVDLSFNVHSIQVDLADSSWPINKVLNSSALKIVESYRKDIITAAKDALKQVFNEYLGTMKSSHFLDVANQDFCTSSLPSVLAI